jgi:hypothetical protein
MRDPEYVLDKARTRYRSTWRDALLGDGAGACAVALDPPTAAEVSARVGDVSAWLTRWREWAARHPEVSVRTGAVRTRFGTQPVCTHLDIPDTSALAGLNPDTAAHWQRARARWNQLVGLQPGQAVRPWLARITDLDDYDFTTLLAATAWFRAHPRSGLTVRSVPVPGMHTKWLARHRGIVLACLGTSVRSTGLTETATGVDPVEIPADELDALGLRALPREVGIVLADPVLRAAVGGLRQVSAPVDELADLRIRPDAVLIVENKEPALAWSDTAGLAVIHSLGNHLDVLGGLPWIPQDRIWYWGDLDRHGFTLLSRARTMLPRLASLLMTPADVAAYEPLGVEESLDRYDQPDPTLTLAETSALAALRRAEEKYLRIEQERIPVSDAEQALGEARDHAALNVREPPLCAWLSEHGW